MYVCMGDIWTDRWTILSQLKFPECTGRQILLPMVLCCMCFELTRAPLPCGYQSFCKGRLFSGQSLLRARGLGSPPPPPSYYDWTPLATFIGSKRKIAPKELSQLFNSLPTYRILHIAEKLKHKSEKSEILRVNIYSLPPTFVVL